MLTRGPPTHKKKGKAVGESSKKARVDALGIVATVSAMDAPEVALKVEAPPTSELGTITEVAGSLVPSNPPIEAHILEPPIEGEKEVEKKKTKRALRKSQWMVHRNGPNSSDEELGENPFNNHEILQGLVDGFTILEVVDWIIDADADQCTWDLLGFFLESPVEANPLPQGVLLKSHIKSLRREVHHLKKKLEKTEDKHKKSKKMKENPNFSDQRKVLDLATQVPSLYRYPLRLDLEILFFSITSPEIRSGSDLEDLQNSF
ncbi:hypothetical protein COCNU_scaffold003914G000010 [Cocos nucifera]|nr:hypothetical protein [Cocos nucifera]